MKWRVKRNSSMERKWLHSTLRGNCKDSDSSKHKKERTEGTGVVERLWTHDTDEPHMRINHCERKEDTEPDRGSNEKTQRKVRGDNRTMRSQRQPSHFRTFDKATEGIFWRRANLNVLIFLKFQENSKSWIRGSEKLEIKFHAKLLWKQNEKQKKKKKEQNDIPANNIIKACSNKEERCKTAFKNL